MRVCSLPAQDRPRERLLKDGPETLSEQELLAIILGSGTKKMPVLDLAHTLLARFGSLTTLSGVTLEELMEIDGIGEAKAIQLKAAFAIGLRAASKAIAPKNKISQPSHVYELIRGQMEAEERELLMVILQDVRCKLICSQVVSIGTIDTTLVHPREVFYPAIRHKAYSMIIAHNHPSGDPTPSFEDYEMTDALVKAGKMIGIPIKDHIVVGRHDYFSFRERGYKF